MNREFNKLFFLTHDQMVVRTPRTELESILYIRDFITYFSLIFSFETSERQIKTMETSNENDEFLQVAICSLAFSFGHVFWGWVIFKTHYITLYDGVYKESSKNPIQSRTFDFSVEPCDSSNRNFSPGLFILISQAQ